LEYGSICANGLVSADRIPHPAYYEVQKIYQNVDFSIDENYEITLKNSFSFKNLKGSIVKIDLLNDGLVQNTKTITIEKNFAPSYEISINPFSKDEIKSLNGDIAINIYLYNSNNKEIPFAKEQFIIADNSFNLNISETSDKKLLIKKLDNQNVIVGENFSIGFHDYTGTLTYWKHNGNIMLRRPVQINFWRGARTHKEFILDKKTYEFEVILSFKAK
jgi:beta-galactosidase